jgi:multidrug efflux pump
MLVMILVVAALGLRSGLMVGLAIPSSFMIGFLLIGLLGFTVNMMLLFGLVVTVGMLVDGSIVLTEFADRKMAEGHPRQEAYIMAAQRMFWPIVSSTLTTLAAFLPLLFWPGVPGEFMKYLPLTVIIVLSASLLTAMIFMPTLGTLIGRTDDETKARFARLRQRRDGRYLPVGRRHRGLSALCRPHHPPSAEGGARRRHAGGRIITTYVNNPTGVEFFVETEPEQAMIFVRARGNLSSEEKLKLVRQVERAIAPVEGIRNIASPSRQRARRRPEPGGGTGRAG